MSWKIEFEERALKELRKLDRQAALGLVDFLQDRIAAMQDPRSVGAALIGSELGEFWKYRVGDYRIIVKIEDHILRILVLRFGHRKEVYKGRK